MMSAARAAATMSNASVMGRSSPSDSSSSASWSYGCTGHIVAYSSRLGLDALVLFVVGGVAHGAQLGRDVAHLLRHLGSLLAGHADELLDLVGELVENVSDGVQVHRHGLARCRVVEVDRSIAPVLDTFDEGVALGL